MRGAPQVGFSEVICKMSSRNSLLMRLRPTGWRERQCQYFRNPSRCQRTTVSGVITTREFFHCNQILLIPTQNSLSNGVRFGLCLRRRKTDSCWRRTRFSSRRSRREQKERQTRPRKSRSRRNMIRIYTRLHILVTGGKFLKSRHDGVLAKHNLRIFCCLWTEQRQHHPTLRGLLNPRFPAGICCFSWRLSSSRLSFSTSGSRSNVT